MTAASTPAPREVVILYTNDLHGHAEPFENAAGDPVGGIAYLAAAMDKVRAENVGKPIFYLDAGDTYQGSILSDQLDGRPMTTFLNQEKADGVVVGNHEFDTGWGVPALQVVAKTLHCPWLGANIIDHRTGKLLPFLAASTVREHRGVRAGIVGVTTPDRSNTPQHNLEHIDLLPMGDTIAKETAALDRQNPDLDLHIAVVHEGADAIRSFAEQSADPFIIIGGHTHQVIPAEGNQPLKLGNSLYVQAGCYGEYLGVMHVFVDPATHAIEKATSEVIQIRDQDLRPDPTLKKLVGQEAKELESRLGRVVGHADVDLTRNNAGESLLSDLICDALREGTGADVAFMNSRNARADIPQGDITLKQLFEVTPWAIPVVTAELKTPDLKQVLEMGVSSKNFGGEHPDILQMSGLKVDYDLGRPEGERVREARLDSGETLVHDGAIVAPDRTIRCSTHDFLLEGGRDYTGFRNATNPQHGALIRDLVAQYLAQHAAPDRPTGRITYTGALTPEQPAA